MTKIFERSLELVLSKAKTHPTIRWDMGSLKNRQRVEEALDLLGIKYDSDGGYCLRVIKDD